MDVLVGVRVASLIVGRAGIPRRPRRLQAEAGRRNDERSEE